MTDTKSKQKLWNQFLTAWPLKKVQAMTLDEYTNLNRSDSFCYWLEKTTESLGSIWGGSSYKFGIYKRNNTDSVDIRNGYKTDGEYAWVLKYGHDRNSAFQTVKSKIVLAVEAALNNQLAKIDDIELGISYKWKIVALYNQKIPLVYKPAAINTIAQKMDISPSLPSSAKFQQLGQLSKGENMIDFSEQLWNMYLNPAIEIERTKEIFDNWQAPLNQILFGPPGTGKTYNTINEAVRLIEKLSEPALKQKYNDDREAIRQSYLKYLESGQIAFCTFHQSFCYEDFIEGIKPVMPSSTEEEKFLSYEIRPGIFLDIARLAVSRLRSEANKEKSFISLTSSEYSKAIFYKVSLGDISIPEEQQIYDYCITNNCISIGFGEGIDFTGKSESQVNELVAKNSYSSYSAQAMNIFKNYLKVGNYVIISKGKYFTRAIGKVTGEYEFRPDSPIRYNHFRNIEWIIANEDIPVNDIYEKNFSQQTIYKLNQEWIKRDFFVNGKTAKLQIEPKPENYVLIIDEINRGNVSQIFGELITLIEDDKRAGKKEELKVTLPYSKVEFSVPANLYLLGTMNTADRSIEALDTALRRRFSFTEIAAKPSLIKNLHANVLVHGIRNLHLEIGTELQKAVEEELSYYFSDITQLNVIKEDLYQKFIIDHLDDIDLDGIVAYLKENSIKMLDFEALLTSINQRIEKLIDKDHCIGHGFFMGLAEHDLPFTALKQVFSVKIIPLLQEYFFGDFGKIGLVLGESFIEKVQHSEFKFAPFKDYDPQSINDLKDRSIYQIKNDSFWNFFNIYN